jgi:hypothetical protein
MMKLKKKMKKIRTFPLHKMLPFAGVTTTYLVMTHFVPRIQSRVLRTFQNLIIDPHGFSSDNIIGFTEPPPKGCSRQHY